MAQLKPAVHNGHWLYLSDLLHGLSHGHSILSGVHHQ